MSQSALDPLLDLELHRKNLEGTIKKLRQSLQHWQIWEAEYEALKEEIRTLPPEPTYQDFNNLANEFRGELLTGKEINELLACHSNKAPSKSISQVTERLSRRIEYVQRNISSIERQISTVESEVEGGSIVNDPALRSEAGLPITEIYEELDNDGNVISSRTSHPNDAEPQILEALKAVGLKKQDLSTTRLEASPSNQHTAPQEWENENLISGSSSTAGSFEQPRRDISDTASTAGVRTTSVSFAEDPSSSTLRSTQLQNSSRVHSGTSADGASSNITKQIFPSNDRILELDEDDKVIGLLPNTSIDESPDDAALRRQMQAYSMTEVGNIVAQMDLDDLDDLDENDSHSSDSYDSEDEIDDEEAHGISVDDHMSPKYVQEMLDLEKKLNANVIQNIGPRSDLLAEGEIAFGPNKSADQAELSLSDVADDSQTEKSKTKSVRFANKLDVADSPPSRNQAALKTLDRHAKPAPVADSIIERVSSTKVKGDESRKLSRFKQSRQSTENVSNVGVTSDQSPPQQSSESNPVRRDIVERFSGSSRAVTNEFDPNLVQQQVKSEYYRQRNRIIQKQGGFKRREVAETDEPAYEDEAEGRDRNKKVSLFKAARVQSGGA